MSEPLPFSTSQPRFSPEEQRRLREIFAPMAQKYRSGSRMAMMAFGFMAATTFTGFLLPKAYAGWIVGSGFICWLVFLGVGITRLGLELGCPACHGNLFSRELGSYCPECGAGSLKPGTWFRSPHCDSCGKSFWRGKGRYYNYKMRACTHCGVMLDERGL